MSTAQHIVCPHCDGVNRVVAERLAQQPRCGRCKQALFSGEPLALDTLRFDKHLTRSDIPLLVDFWASWCGPCKMMAPAFEAAATQIEPRARLIKIDTEAEQALAGRYRIRSIPTLVVFHGGREAARQMGAMGTADIIRWVQPYLR